MLERTPIASFTEVIERANPYTVGKSLDTMADVEGDTILAPTAVESLDLEAMDVASEALDDYLATTSEKADIQELAQSAIVRNKLTELALIRANHEQVTGEVDHSATIHELQKSLYDHYSPALFRAALHAKIEVLESTEVPKDLEAAKAALLDELEIYANSPEPEVNETRLEQPREETLHAVGEWLHAQFEDIFDEIDAIDGDELDAEQLVYIFNLAIATTPSLRENGWRAEVLERNKNAVSVYASDRAAVVSAQRRVSKSVAKKLVVHEIFGHALRSSVAETNDDTIGTIGTATYARFEESLEIALEQCMDGVYDPRRGLDHYISIGLAETVGLSRDKIAQLTKSMRQLTLAGSSLTPEKIEKANVLTENQIRRTFAGMTDVDDGTAHRKDIDYLHGLNGAWKLLNAIVAADQVDEGLRWLLQAKFNPYDSIDRQLVEHSMPMPSSIKEALEV